MFTCCNNILEATKESSLPSLQVMGERIGVSWANKESALSTSRGTHVYLNTKRVLEYDVRSALTDK